MSSISGPSRGRRGRQAYALAAALASAMALLALATAAWGQTTSKQKIDEDPRGAPYVAGELLVAYESGVSTGTEERASGKVEGQVEEEIPELDTKLIEFPEVKQEPSQAQREKALARKKDELEQSAAIEAVDYNYIRKGTAAPNDPGFDLQYGLTNIKSPRAWDTVQGGGVDIAVVDSGIDTDHPDLASKIKAQRNFVGSTDSSSAEDDNGHGTHVAGIAAAITNNDKGVAGTCPKCDLLIAKSLKGDLTGTDADIVQGIRWAVKNGAEVINLSLGGTGDSDTLERAINNAWEKGVAVVAAAGNSAQEGNPVIYPAAYPKVIAVAATDKNDKRAFYSSFGSYVDVAAPGGSGRLPKKDNIYSTLPPGTYGYEAGTSMASPHVAGVAGLLAAQNRSAVQIRRRIETTAVDLGPDGRDNSYGNGLVNAAAAVRARQQQPKNDRPMISDPRPKPGSKIKDRTPTIRAMVRDKKTDLKRSDIKLFVDGKDIRSFEYNAKSNRLSYTPKGRLDTGRHSVRVAARDEKNLKSKRNWRFKIRSSGRGPGPGVVGPGGSVPDVFDFSNPGYPFNVLPDGFPFDVIR